MGLENRLVDASGDAAGLAQGTLGRHFREPQLAAVPGHVGVVPGEPGQGAAIGAEPRAGIEVGARDQHPPGLRRALQGEAHDLVDRLGRALAMVLAHADEAIAAAVHDRVGVTPRALRRERGRFGAGGLSIEARVGEVAEHHEALGGDEGAAAVFVHPAAGVEGGGGEVGESAVGRAPHDHRAAAFVGARFAPVDLAGGRRHLAEGDGPLHHRGGADGRFPGPVGRDCGRDRGRAHDGGRAQSSSGLKS